MPNTLKRLFIFIYGTLSYLIFLASFLYAIGWVGGFLVPTTLDGTPTIDFQAAALINIALLSLFALPHSVMARPGFKRWWTKIVPEAAERSTYVLQSSILLFVVMIYWQPMGGMIWDVQSPLAYWTLYGLFGFGWGLVLISTFAFSHFDLFGLRQVVINLVGCEYTTLEFGTPFLYRLVRHPLYVGWFFAFWATPTMTSAHLLFAAVCSIYILVAIQLEERDLIKEFGEDYIDYQKQVPMIVPRITPANVEMVEAD